MRPVQNELTRHRHVSAMQARWLIVRHYGSRLQHVNDGKRLFLDLFLHWLASALLIVVSLLIRDTALFDAASTDQDALHSLSTVKNRPSVYIRRKALRQVAKSESDNTDSSNIASNTSICAATK
jgi:hypothetical protein